MQPLRSQIYIDSELFPMQLVDPVRYIPMKIKILSLTSMHSTYLSIVVVHYTDRRLHLAFYSFITRQSTHLR